MEDTDASVVSRVRCGDRDAFRSLVDRHSRAVFRLAFRMTGNETDAEDIVQETFLRAYRELARYESRSSFGTWLYRIATNCSLDLIRTRRFRGELPQAEGDASDPMEAVPSSAPDPHRLAASREQGERVAEAMTQLSSQERVAFVLRHFEGLSIDQIGGVLGVGDNAAKHSIFRAVRKLRAALEPQGVA
jgi:RNA polymerase sigma-70 factor, ECF subfamily